MKPLPIVVIAVLLLGFGIYAFGGFGDSSAARAAAEADLYTVQPGDLRIEVTEDGELEAANSEKVRSQIEGRNTIEWLIPEGTNVQKGERLAVLDISSFKDREESQAISVSRARSELVSAETSFQIQESQNASDIDKATTKLYFAQLDFEKFTGQKVLEGKQTVDEILAQWSQQAQGELAEMERNSASRLATRKEGAGPEIGTDGNAPVPVAPDATSPEPAGTELVAAEPVPAETGTQTEEPERAMSEGQQRLDQTLSDISLKQEALSQAEEKLAWTRRLYAKKYVPEQDLQRDEFAVDKASYDLEVAKSKLRLLITYDLRKEIRDLESKVQEARDELERTKLRCRAQLESKKSDWDAKKQQFDIEVSKLAKLRENIQGGTILSPSAGLVVYGKSGNWRREEPIDVGTEVQRGQTILILPDTSKMIARLNIPEAQREQIEPGQPATLTVESNPGVTYTGVVSYIGQTADTQSSWLNPDVKQYRCTVEVQGDTSQLRPNQSANVTIQVATLQNVLFVPIQAVHRARNVHYVWVYTSSGPIARRVEIGRANAKFVELSQGVQSGDRIYLHDVDSVERPKFEAENAEIENRRAQEEAQRLEAASERVKEIQAGAGNGDAPRARPIEATAPSGGGESEVPAEGQGPRRSGGMTAFNELFEEAKTAFPEYAEQLADPRQRFGLMRDEEFRKKLEEHATLGPKWKALTENMRNRRPRRPEGQEGQGGEERRPRGDGQGMPGSRGPRGGQDGE